METGISKDGIKYTVISSNDTSDLTKLFEIYANDRLKAKVIFDHRKGSVRFARNRFVLFEYSNGDFRFAKLERKYGISKTNVIYSRESCCSAYGMKNGKFYKVENNRVYLLRVNDFLNLDKFQSEFFLGRFGWIRNLLEDERCGLIDLNHVIKYKLFNVKACLRHIYKVPYPVADMLSKSQHNFPPWDFLKMWKEMKKTLINIENLKMELFNDKLFKDTTLMANSLGRKVNCSWSNKRLKLEHDRMSREIIDIILEFEELRNLKINPIFKKFQEFSGYKMFLTNHDLIEEGKMMNHCVGTYSGNVDSGRSSIYRVNGYTLELTYGPDWIHNPKKGEVRRNKISVSQYMGYGNTLAPNHFKKEVIAMVEEFNLSHCKVEKVEKVEGLEDMDDVEFLDLEFLNGINNNNDLPF